MNLDLLDILKARYGVTGLRHLGDGGFGVVYSGNVFEVPRAIKVSRDILDQKLLAMADQELGFMRQPAIVDCPTIVQLIAVWRELGHLITVWELGEQSLAARLADCRRQGLNGLPSEELERHLCDAAAGLDVINSLGIRHRDIKPDNIVLVRGRAKITDLGLAVFVGASSLSKTASGTMGYVAPEAYGDEGHGRLTATVDIYALAATAIKLATGRDPFGTNPREIVKSQDAGQPDTTGLSEPQIAAVLRALHPDPQQRQFRTAMEFVEEFVARQNVTDDDEAVLQPAAPVSAWAQTLFEKGVARREQSDPSGAIAYFTTVIDLPNASVDLKAQALNYRGLTHGEQGDVADEIADYTTLIELPNAPVEWMARALFYRGVTHGKQGDVADEIADYTTVIELPDAPVEWIAQALYNRGVTHGEQGDVADQIADYTTVIELPNAPVEWMARALYYRGVTHGEQGDVADAIADYTTLIELPNAPVDLQNFAVEERNRLSS